MINKLLFRLILKKIFKNKTRLIVTVLSIFISITILLSFASIGFNLRNKVIGVSNSLPLIKEIRIDSYRGNDYVESDGVTKYRKIYNTDFEVIINGDEDTYKDAVVKTFSSSENLFFQENIDFAKFLEVEYLFEGRAEITDDEVLINYHYLNRTKLDIEINDRIEIRYDINNIKEFTVAGFINTEPLSVSSFDFIIKNTDLTTSHINSVQLIMEDFNSLVKLCDELKNDRISYDSVYQNFKSMLMTFDFGLILLYLLGSLLSFVSLLSMFSTISASIEEKKKLVCLLFVLGEKESKIKLLFLIEILVIGTLSFLLSLITLTIANAIIINNVSLNFANMEFNNVLSLNVISVITSYVILIILLTLIYLRPIKKMSIKLPGELS